MKAVVGRRFFSPAAPLMEGLQRAEETAEPNPLVPPDYLLGAGDVLVGPAVIQEVTTTLVIEPEWKVELDATGVYVVTQTGAA